MVRIKVNGDGMVPDGKSYIVVDSKLMLGALKALVTHGERERINSRGR